MSDPVHPTSALDASGGPSVMLDRISNLGLGTRILVTAITIVVTADAEVSVDQPSTMRVGDVVPVNYRVTNVGADFTSGSPSISMKIDLDTNLAPVNAISSDGWECYFEPISKCAESHVWQVSVVRV